MKSQETHKRSLFSTAINSVLLVLILCVATAHAQTTTFTYQGRFTDGGTAANGIYDMQFKLFDSTTVGTGNQIGSTITNATVTITDGVFTVQLDFGAAAFPGAERFVEIGVRPNGSIGAYTVLSPRQQLTSAVYAIKARSATTADTAANSNQLGGVSANQYVTTSDSRLTDSRFPLAGSGFYIQNSTGPQVSSNFNISGNGTAGGTLSANTVNATTQYNIAGNRVLSIAGTGNAFAGLFAGNSNSGTNNSFFGFKAGGFNGSAGDNSFFGAAAGSQNSSGDDDSFFGAAAGTANTTGFDNSFFGSGAGTANKIGNNNSFFGSNSGLKNTNSDNSFFGFNSGLNNTTGLGNSFFGEGAGQNNITGDLNAFFGQNAGSKNTSGAGNTFIGQDAGGSHLSGNNNTALGANTSVSNGITNATAIGANAFVTQSNTMVLGTTGIGVYIPGLLNVEHQILVTPQLGGSSNLCLNSGREIAFCSSSLRYKKDMQPFTRGLALLNQLKPITFKWKSDNSPDLGFGAEDVGAVEPLLVSHNGSGQIEGVKYDRITAVLVNSVKEQQEQIGRQEKLIASLKILVCRRHSRAAVCR